ncbi:MAG: Clp1/GlmU family protein [Candidatus Methanomethyliaceae archaeon]|nr:Clp1/GlmU family protein [Candidatus Methanomethyliaceae archaeon]MDW7970556.1 Clp1/GlmU family protein [Nitrososphaerota archaeon]
MPTMDFEKGITLVASGPLSLRLRRGLILALGKKVELNEEIVIREGKSIPIEVIEDSSIDVKLGQNAFIEKFEGAIPSSWKNAIEEVLKHPPPIKVVVIGDVDSGKTTFSVYLSNIAHNRGFKVAIIDADPGQAEISLPNTIGYGLFKNGVISMDKIQLEEGFFIGSTTPSDAPIRMMIGTRKLMDKALLQKADIVVVNTCGWISGYRAREYKCALIQILSPNFLIAIQKENELEHIIRCCEPYGKILRITPSSASRVRSREERKNKREDAYSKYFANSRERIFDLNKVRIICNCYTYGRELPNSLIESLNKELSLSIIYGELYSNSLFLVVKEEPNNIEILRERFGVNDIILINEGSERGIIVGLMNDDKLVGLGLVSKIDYWNRRISIQTPYSGEVSHICIGQVKLNEELREILKYYRLPI